MRGRPRWTTVVLHSIDKALHRYECQCCGQVWETVRHYDWGNCPFCGFVAWIREEGDDEPYGLD